VAVIITAKGEEERGGEIRRRWRKKVEKFKSSRVQEGKEFNTEDTEERTQSSQRRKENPRATLNNSRMHLAGGRGERIG